MELGGLKLWQVGTVLGIATASSLQAPSVGFAFGTFLGVAAVFWMVALNVRKGLRSSETTAA